MDPMNFVHVNAFIRLLLEHHYCLLIPLNPKNEDSHEDQKIFPQNKQITSNCYDLQGALCELKNDVTMSFTKYLYIRSIVCKDIILKGIIFGMKMI